MHAPGWIELYTILESGGDPPEELVSQCKAGFTTHTRESMLHWYAIEGAPFVVQRLIDLGFDVDAEDASGSPPIQSAAMIQRWDMVRVLRDAGARRAGVDTCGNSYRSELTKFGDAVPVDLRKDAYQLDDLLRPGGPESSRVTRLDITQEGGSIVPGIPLQRDAWMDFGAQDPELEDASDGDFLVKGVDGTFGGLLSFDYQSGLTESAQVVVIPQGDSCLRAAYRVARYFDARVIWSFECRSTSLPEPARRARSWWKLW